MDKLYFCMGSLLACSAVWRFSVVGEDYRQCVISLLFSIYFIAKGIYFRKGEKK